MRATSPRSDGSAPALATSAVRCSASLTDGLRHPRRLQILFRLAEGNESVASLAEIDPAPAGMLDYHLRAVLHRELGFVREVGQIEIRGVEDQCFAIDWRALNLAVLWSNQRDPGLFRSASTAFGNLIEEGFGLLEEGTLGVDQGEVHRWFQDRLGDLDGRLVRSLVADAAARVRAAGAAEATRGTQLDGVRGAVVVAAFGTRVMRPRRPAQTMSDALTHGGRE